MEKSRGHQTVGLTGLDCRVQNCLEERGRDRERIWERAQEIGIQRLASDFGREDAPFDRAEFQKDHGRERCADGKDSGIAEVILSHEQLSMIWAGKSPDLSGRHSKESAVAVGKEFWNCGR